MKKLLSILSILTLASTSIGTTISTNINSNIKVSNTNSNQNYNMKYINSPIGNRSLLTTAGDWLNPRGQWAYITINLGKMKQEQIMGIGSRDNDSYTEHKVNCYDYHKKDDKAGIHHGPNFRDYFFERKEKTDGGNAEMNAKINFQNEISWGWAKHRAIGTIKFLWHYNSNSELLIDIVGTLKVAAFFSSCEGVASIKLGNTFRIFYTD